MLISQILAWICVILCILEALKYVARVSKIKPMNRFFRRIHIPFGLVLLVVGLLHGVLAGNPAKGGFSFAPVLFTLNAGTVCYLLGVLLLLTYIFRKKLKRNWMRFHRILTVAMLLFMVIHIIDVGATLPARWMQKHEPSAPVVTQPSADPIPTDSLPTGSLPTGTETNPVQVTFPTETQPPKVIVYFSGAELADGYYRGSSDGYRGQIGLTVRVQGGKVTEISVYSQHETEKYYNRAVSVIDTILAQQSLEVDTVSGATYSSRGIINAVYNALEGAVISGELKIS